MADELDTALNKATQAHVDESAWKQYLPKASSSTEAREYVPGEDLSKISVQTDYVPKLGDKICRNPRNRDDQWLVEQSYFESKYEVVDTRDF